MAKASKRVAGKKTSKPGKPSTKPATKKTAERTPAKKTKSKPSVSGAAKSAPGKKPAPKSAVKKTARKPPAPANTAVETTIIDVIEQPAPGAFVITEYETVEEVVPVSPGRARKPRQGSPPKSEGR